MYPGKILITMR
jgi:hypothetical protein